MTLEFYSPEFALPIAFALVPKISTFKHRFGGQRWQAIDSEKFFEGPSLLFTLDLSDPKLAPLQNCGLAELPLCSYINTTVMYEPQSYRIDSQNSEVHWVSKLVNQKTGIDNSKFKFPNILPERIVALEDLSPADYPIDLQHYEHCVDELNCGKVFCRVLGVPIWYDDREEPSDIACFTCSAEMIHVMTLGSETVHRDDFVPGDTFYLGDLYLHFFFCKTCLTVTVTSWSLQTD